MDDEEVVEVTKEEDGEISITPLEVKIVNTEKKVVSVYDDKEDLEYEDLNPTDEQIQEFEENK